MKTNETGWMAVSKTAPEQPMYTLPHLPSVPIKPPQHEHIQAFIMYELEKALQQIQRRGIGFVENTSKQKIEYRIDNVVYTLSISEKG